MKTRNGFVSNSSSSSFVVCIDSIPTKDALRLLEYNKETGDTDYWDIGVDFDRGIIRGFASMDNGNLSEYMKRHGINEDLFVWESC